MKKIKFLCLLFFIALGFAALTNSKRFVHTAVASSAGPPAGVSGAPGESNCTACHESTAGAGQFTITAPANYTPGQTYQIVVQHASADSSRRRWGFQLTPLAGTAAAGFIIDTSPNTQTFNGGNGRFYTEHTITGTFAGQAGGAVWTFNWTAPETNVGPVTFYASGNQANNDGTASADRIFTTSSTSQPAPVVSDSRFFDFDGDNKTDISIYRPSLGQWWYQRSSDGQVPAFQFGNNSDKIAPADYTGDGKTDVAIFRPPSGEWFVLRSEDSSYYSFPFGTSEDIPAPGDFDADDKADPAIFRPSSATWFILRSTGGTHIEGFGLSTDVPVVADYDGDNKADIAIYRPSNGQWWINRSTAGLIAYTFGDSADKTVQGDYTGDGKADVAIYRPSTGNWFILRSEDSSFFSFPFGTSTDIPAPGDYDGDGKFDAGIFRPSEATWFVQRSTAGTLILGFGLNGDQPVPNAFVR